MLTCWNTVYIDALACMFSKGCFMTCFPASEKWSWNSRSQDLWQLEACFTHFACGSATYWHQPTQNSIQYVCVSVCVGDSPRAGALRSNAWHIFRISVFFFGVDVCRTGTQTWCCRGVVTICYNVCNGKLLASIPDPGSLQIVAPSTGQRKRAETCSTGANLEGSLLCNMFCATYSVL